MSKKSRKRNKKILAAIGLGLGAAAMASRKKADLASTEDGKSAKADRGFTMADVANTPKKDTAKKSDYKDSIMSGGSGVKYSKSKPIKKARITLIFKVISRFFKTSFFSFICLNACISFIS